MKNSNKIYIILLIIVSVFLVFISYKLIKPKKINMDNIMDDFIGKDLEILENKYKDNSIKIEVLYEYNDNVEKDKIINQSILGGTEIKNGDILKVTVSLGKLDLKKLSQDKINELGKIPVMMYHGIKDIPESELKYTGGNIDKDGYTRTTEAFKKDLEFFYKEGYRMIKISDYISGDIDTPYGKSPIVLTFDDGNANNIKVTGLDQEGNIIIDKSSAVGILEEFKHKYPDFNVTASFYLTNNLFNQKEYDEKIIKWLIDNGYEVGNHTKGHNNFNKIDEQESEAVVGYMYDKLNSIIPGKYLKVVALPFGSPYKKEHANYPHIIDATYNARTYHTQGALRVGWEPEESPFNKKFDPEFIKRCRAYDNNGKEFDIDMVFNSILKKKRYISDGNAKTIVTNKQNENLIVENTDKKLVLY